MIKLGNNTTQRMSDAEVLDCLYVLEGFQDAYMSGEFDDKIATSDRIKTLKAMFDNKNPEFNALIAERPEFYGLSTESIGIKLRDMVKTQCISVAEEGHIHDLNHDTLLGMILHWDEHTASALKKLIPEMKTRVMEADASIFGKWKLFFQIGIYSKYLPDWQDFAGAVKCLKDQFGYLKSTKPDKFNPNKYIQFFTNTCYNDNGVVQEYMKAAMKAKAAEGGFNITSLLLTDAILLHLPTLATICGYILPALAIAAVAFKWSSDIRKRGWTERSQFLKALDEAAKLVKEMEALALVVGKYKGHTFEGDKYVISKAYFKAAEQTTMLAGYLGRGVVAASRSIGGSVWRRIFTLDK